MENKKQPHLLIILDGWGINPETEGNAIALAKTPVLDDLISRYPHTQLKCSGEAVGLPEGYMGNSEVGHLNLGAGRVVYQDFMRINMAIGQGAFFQNSAFTALIHEIQKNDSALHLMGLVSDGGVHSHMDHLYALLDLAKQKGLKKVYVHAILDGRDTPPQSGAEYVADLQGYMDENGIGDIASVCGRFYAMDRDTRWDRIEKAFLLYTQGQGVKESDPVAAVKNAYAREETDEFVRPVILTDEKETPKGIVGDGDGIIFFNFRADRARELTLAFTADAFDHFPRDPLPRLAGYVCMTQYDERFERIPVAFPPVHLENIFGEVASQAGLRQLRIAETEKYAHVTYFFNGGEESPFDNEDRCLIPSPREVRTYDEKPEMSAYQVADEVVSRLESGQYDVVILNFANMDMVGHTGILEAAISACQAVDACVGKVVKQAQEMGGTVLITADHGNAEKMKGENSQPHTAHTTNPVPFILVDEKRKSAKLRDNGILGDIAPTLLAIMGMEKPQEMDGKSLITES